MTVRPSSEHEAIVRIIRDIVEDVVAQSSPVMGTVSWVEPNGAIRVRLDHEEQVRRVPVARSASSAFAPFQRVLMVKTMANELVAVCPVIRPMIEGTLSGYSTPAADGSGPVAPEAVRAQAEAAAAEAAEAVPSTAAEPLDAGSVTRRELGTDAVGTGNIEPGAVTADRIAAGAVGPAQLQDRAVTTGKLALGSVTRETLAPGAIPDLSLQDASVATAKLQDRAVTTGKIADGAVTGAKIADGTIRQDKLAFSPALASHAHDMTVEWDDIRQLKVPVATTTASGTPTSLTLEALLELLVRQTLGGTVG